MPPDEILEAHKLDLELYAGLKVVQSQQTEINRRIGDIERTLKEKMIDPERVLELEQWREGSSDQRRGAFLFVLQIVGQVVLVTALVWLGSKLGVDVKW